MRIAQVSPLYESVPPKFYGGTERVVSYLTEALINMRHDVTLFASGDSNTRARLIPTVPKALRLCQETDDPLAAHFIQLEQVYALKKEFDFVHFHTDFLHFPTTRREPLPHLTTLHGRLDLPSLTPLYRIFNEMPVTSISHRQREPLPQANWQATVYHGLPLDLYSPTYQPKHYAAFLGRICYEKRVDLAIEIAQTVGTPLKIAAKIENCDRTYFQRYIEPLFELPQIDYVGEVNEIGKTEFLGNAECLLFPIDWPEPFGLVMIEAMACGTPVLAFDRGSVPEIIEPGVTGFIVNSVEEAVEIYPQLIALDRHRIRQRFCERFSAERMASDYLALYQRLLKHDEKDKKRNQSYAQ